MKTRVVMPILALILGTGAAFGVQSKRVSNLHTGYLQVVENGEIRCEPVKTCSDNIEAPICTWGVLQVKGMDDFGACTVTLYEDIESN